jgi:hypothetical protein
VLLGGTVGPVKAYNSNGLWLREPEQIAKEAIELRDEGQFIGLKLRLGRESALDDLRAIRPRHARHRDGALAGMAGLGRSCFAKSHIKLSTVCFLMRLASVLTGTNTRSLQIQASYGDRPRGLSRSARGSPGMRRSRPE